MVAPRSRPWVEIIVSMQRHDISHYRHAHVFHYSGQQAEKKTMRVVWLTVSMMVVEIVAGWLFNSMALLADGWHMSTHAAALGISWPAFLLRAALRGGPALRLRHLEDRSPRRIRERHPPRDRRHRHGRDFGGALFTGDDPFQPGHPRRGHRARGQRRQHHPAGPSTTSTA